MTLDWSAVRDRYATEVSLAPLAGNSRLTAVLIEGDTIRVRQKLWQLLLTRSDLDTAAELLDQVPRPVNPVQFAERLRAHYTSTTECSRIPNVSAIILTDLGLLSR
jgi:hypothetical protein